jgi:uncharacterized membrane protein YuzA (DUF378 family)
MRGSYWIALILLIVGGLNWLLVGAFGFDLVAAIFGEMSSATRVIYVLVGLSAVWVLINALRARNATPTYRETMTPSR